MIYKCLTPIYNNIVYYDSLREKRKGFLIYSENITLKEKEYFRQNPRSVHSVICD